MQCFSYVLPRYHNNTTLECLSSTSWLRLRLCLLFLLLLQLLLLFLILLFCLSLQTFFLIFCLWNDFEESFHACLLLTLCGFCQTCCATSNSVLTVEKELAHVLKLHSTYQWTYLKPLSLTKNSTSPSTFGASHLNWQSSWSADRTSGLKNSSLASLYGQSSGMTYFAFPASTAATKFSSDLYSRMSFSAVFGPIFGIGSR